MSGLLKFITCGSVDDGKSTLIGHILYDSKLLYADQEKALLLDSRIGSRGGEIDYSLLLDGLMAEREQGITIDVAYRYFTTARRSFIVADTPGHEEYTRNMAVGASFAQLAIVMIDAKQGVLIQTRRHARICAMMGIRYFVFAVNKMDLVDYSEARFEEVKGDIKALADELHLYSVKIIPVSATAGDNVTHASNNMPWYEEAPLLSYLEEVDVSRQEAGDVFYLPVQRVCRPNHEFRGFQGQIECGKIQVGDVITTLPSKEAATVKGILNGCAKVERAAAGQAVTIQLDKEVDVSRGCVLTSWKELPVEKQVTVSLLWMDDERLFVGKEYLVKLGTRKFPGTVREIFYKVDVNTGEQIPASYIEKNEIALCRIEFAEKIVVDAFKRNKTLGELILIDRVSHMTSACGVVEELHHAVDEKPYFEKGKLKAGGYIFEELYFNLDQAALSRMNGGEKTYRAGDLVPVAGDSYQYPDYFDIVAAESRIVVLIRSQRIQDIIPLEAYQFTGLPVVDERGFALYIKSEADFDNFRYELEHLKANERTEFFNKWSRFELYRKIVCTDNFWVI